MKNSTKFRLHGISQHGVALVIAIIVTLVVILVIASTLYVINRSTSMSGAGKRYETASQAADGAVDVMKDSIGLLINGEPENSLPFTNYASGTLASALLNPGSPVTVALTLPGQTLMSSYSISITVERLFSKNIPGSRIQFPPSASGPGGTGLYFRISTVAAGPNNTTAETSAVYRYVN